MSEEELAQVAKMVLEEAENITEVYFYNGWAIPGQGIKLFPKVEQEKIYKQIKFLKVACLIK
jgi:hypothetical protein